MGLFLSLFLCMVYLMGKLKIVNAVSVMVTEGRKILLGKRIASVADGYWSTPGGKQEPGESVIKCAIRELKEETGLIAKPEGCVNLGWGERFDWGGHFITAYVWVKESYGFPKAMEPRKCKEWQWLGIHCLPFPCTEPWWVTDKLREAIEQELKKHGA